MASFFSLVVKQVDLLQVFNDISTSSTNVKFELDLVFYLQYLKLGITWYKILLQSTFKKR